MRGQTTNEMNKQPWLRRLSLPAYQVREAARYARVNPQTIRNWQKQQAESSALSPRDAGASLSYLQLIELAVVAAMRNVGVSLKAIKEAKQYMAQQFRCEYPFAQYNFKTDGKNVIAQLRDLDIGESPEKLIVLNKRGQLGWNTILEDRLKEFEYDRGLALRWNVGGVDSSVSIDPQVSFGAPTIKGVPTWTLRGRLDAGETVDEIADDFLLDPKDVREALAFEGVDINKITNAPEWQH